MEDGLYLYLNEYVKLVNYHLNDVYRFTEKNNSNKYLQLIIEVVRDAMSISPAITHTAKIITEDGNHMLCVEIFVAGKLYAVIRDLYDETTKNIIYDDVSIKYYG